MGKNSSLGDTFEKAWGAALIKGNSTFFRQTGGIADLNDVSTLYDYVQKNPNAFTNKINREKKFDDKLRKYYVMEVDDKTGRGDNNKATILTDNKGQDIALIYIRDSQVVVEVSPSLLKNNEKMLKLASISENGQMLEIGNVEELAKIMEPDSLDKIVDQIEKYDSVKMRGRDDARNRVKDLGIKEKERAEVGGDLNDGKEVNQEEEELSEEEIEETLQEQNIETSELDAIVKVCKEHGLDPRNIKQTAEVQSAKDLIEDIDNDRTRVNPAGGKVTVLRFKNGDLSQSSDKIFMIQDGQLLPADSANDDKVSTILDENKGDNVRIHNFDDPRETEVLAEIAELKMDYESEIEKITNPNVANDPESIKELLDTVTDRYKDKVEKTLKEFNPKVTRSEQHEEDAKKDIDATGEQAKDEINAKEEPEEDEEHQLPEEHKFPEGPWENFNNKH